MTPGADSGRLPAAYLVPGSSSFTEFLSAQAPTLLPSGRTLPPGAAIDAPHGTTIVTLTYAGGVVMAGDRRATMGNLIANRDMEKVFATDEYSLVGIAGTAGLAIELVRLFQVELEHYEKIEGTLMSLEGKANRLASMIRGNLGMAMQGLSVVPLFAGYDIDTGIGRIFSYDVTGRLLRGARPPQRRVRLAVRPGLAEEALPPRRHPRRRRAHRRRGALRRCRRRLRHRGSRRGRRIWPTIGVVDDDGARFVPDDEIAPVVDAIIASRVDNPGGAR